MAVLAVVLVAVAGVLVVAGSRDDDGDDGGGDIAAACRASNARIATAQRALLEDNEAPDRFELFLGDAFVDLMRDRSAAIRALEPSAEVLAVLDEHDAVVDAVEADPETYVFEDPFADVDARWQALELDDCIVVASTVDAE